MALTAWDDSVAVIEYLCAPGADSLGVPVALSFNDASVPELTRDSVTSKPISKDTLCVYLDNIIVFALATTKCFLI